MNTVHPPMHLDALVNPRSIAIVGATERAGHGADYVRNLIDTGYSGAIYPVNPKYESIFGLKAYPSVSALPEPADLAVISIPYQGVVPVLEEAVLKGVRSALVGSGGFSEGSDAGRLAQQRMVELARSAGMPLMGPNCLGFINVNKNVFASGSPLPREMRPGGISAIFQSGTVLVDALCSERRLGFNCLISSGNEAVVDMASYIDYFLDDPSTKLVISYVEGFRDGRRFREVAHKARLVGKPIILLKVGRSEAGARAALAHTGSLAGMDQVVDAICKETGVIRVDDIDELLETAELLSKVTTEPRSAGICLVSVSGGENSMAADLAEGLGVRFADLSADGQAKLRELLPPYVQVNNPMDLGAAGLYDVETYGKVLRQLAQEPDVGVLLLSQIAAPGTGPGGARNYRRMAEVGAEVAKSSPIPTVFFSFVAENYEESAAALLRNSNAPALHGIRTTLKAIAGWQRFHAARSRARATVSTSEAPDLQLPQSGGAMTERESKQLLSRFGIPVTRELLVSGADEAAVAAATLGFPVVMKVESVDIPHKTEAGGVRLGIRTPADARTAYEEIVASAHRYRPNAHLAGVLVQEQVLGGVETIAGIKVDPVFGPVVLFGMGGVLAELLKDVSVRPVPLTPKDAREMIAETMASRMIAGFRGSPPGDLAALTDALVRLGQLAMQLEGKVVELDINPLVVLPEGQGVRALDGLVVLA